MKTIYIERETGNVKNTRGQIVPLASNTRKALTEAGSITETVRKAFGAVKGESVVIREVDWVHAF